MFISDWTRRGSFIWIVSFVFIVASNSVDISGCNGKWVYDVKLFPTNNTHGVVHILGEPFLRCCIIRGRKVRLLCLSMVEM